VSRRAISRKRFVLTGDWLRQPQVREKCGNVETMAQLRHLYCPYYDACLDDAERSLSGSSRTWVCGGWCPSAGKTINPLRFPRELMQSSAGLF
jgi:hypothetical protein